MERDSQPGQTRLATRTDTACAPADHRRAAGAAGQHDRCPGTADKAIAGAALLATGLFLFSTIGPDTPAWLSGIYTAVLGAGMAA